MSQEINTQIRSAFAPIAKTDNQFKIGILRDDNVSIFSVRLSIQHAFPGAHICDIDAHMSPSEYQSRLRGLNLLVLPGVAKETCLYHAPLMAARDVVAQAVFDDGLSILGICAGKYNLYDTIIYRGSDGKIKEQQGLGFLKGTSLGPVDKDFVESSDMPSSSRFDGTRTIKITYNTMAGQSIETDICYGDGPAGIIDPDDNCEAIARYTDYDGQPVAIASKVMGRGLIIGTGVLPEIALSHMILDDNQAHLFPAIAALRDAMEPHEANRQLIMDDIVGRFNRHRNLATAGPSVLSMPA